MFVESRASHCWLACESLERSVITCDFRHLVVKTKGCPAMHSLSGQDQLKESGNRR